MMKQTELDKLYAIDGKVAAITGGGGVLCSEISRCLGRLDVKVAVLDIAIEPAVKVAQEIQAAGGEAESFQCDVLNKASVESAAQSILQRFGRIDILINGAGGNKPQATTSAERSFFNLPADAVQWVFNLNFIGSFIPSQVFGKLMVEQEQGVILNISSMSAFAPLTRVSAYSAAKAAISNFTQWLAVHMAQEYTPNIRVNAIAPGFFLTEQNRYLLTKTEDGTLTTRGQQIISHTPANRFGEPEDLLGTVIWLLSPSAQFVTGVVVPIDGGFNAYSGV
jgi:NAD(P)-dependent dehydrogenase (short-subunit alcohol dehydrogenase family)